MKNSIRICVGRTSWFLTLALLCMVSGCRTPLRSVVPIENFSRPDAVFWIDTDIGVAPDDIMALLVARRQCGERLIGVSTTLLWPSRQAAIARLILDALGFGSVYAHAGIGIAPGSESEFEQRYSAWPPDYGSIEQLERAQLAVFSERFGRIRVNETPVGFDGVGALLTASKAYSKKLVIIALGPLTNIAAALQRDPEFATRILGIVAMGGYYKNSDGTIRRPSYNTAMDLAASAQVFANPRLPVLLINSQTLADASMYFTPAEFTRATEVVTVTPLASTLQETLRQWTKASNVADGRVSLADAVTSYVACNTGWIAETEPQVLIPQHISGIRLTDARANELLRVTSVTNGSESSVAVVTRFVKSANLRQHVVDNVITFIR